MDDNWDYREERRVYEEDTTATELNIAVGKIADAIVGTVTAMASGGALAPLLLKSLRDTVVSAGWSSTDKRDKLVKKVFGRNVCIYLEIDKITQTTNKKVMGSTRSSLHLCADTKFLMMTALNKLAKEQLHDMKAKEAEDKLQYINAADGWRAEQKRKIKDGDRIESTFCQRSEMCSIM